MSTRVDVEDVVRLVDEGAQTIDVSSPDDFTTGHLPGAVSIPIAALRRNQVDDLDRSAPVLVYAQSCDSDASTRAAALLERFGFAQVRVFIMGPAQ